METKKQLVEEFEKLGITVTYYLINKWVDEGMPCKKKGERVVGFFFDDVVRWLKIEKNCDVKNPYYLTLMTIQELANEFDITVQTIRFCVKNKGLPYSYFVNGKMAFDLQDVEVWAKLYLTKKGTHTGAWIKNEE